jgi:hypothetical protein
VIRSTLKPGLAPSQALQPPFGVLRPLALVLLAARGPALAGTGDGLTGERFARAVGGQLDDAEIDPQEVLDLDGGRLGKVNGGQQVELAAPADQVALPFDVAEPPGLIRAVGQGNHLPPLQGGQAHPVESLEREVALVVGDGAVGPECRTCGLVTGKAFDCLGDGPDGELGRQAEAAADLGVSPLVNAGLTEHAGVETHAGRACRHLIEAAHGAEQERSLLGCRQQLGSCNRGGAGIPLLPEGSSLLPAN